MFDSAVGENFGFIRKVNTMKRLLFLPLIFIVSTVAYAGTPLYSTKVDRALSDALDATGKWKRIFVSPGQEAQVRSDLGVTSSATAVRRIESLGSDVTLTGTTTQTTMWSFTVPGGSLGTTGSIEISTLWNSTALGQKTITMKYGGNMIRSVGMGTTTTSLLIPSWIFANGSTTAQKMPTISQINPYAASGGVLTTTTTDSTVDQTLLVLMTLGTSTESVTLNAGSFATLYP